MGTFYGTHYARNEKALRDLQAATLALGTVLSTPAGVVVLGNLSDARHFGNELDGEYLTLCHAGKRPSKRREEKLRWAQHYLGEAEGYMEALIAMVMLAGGYEFDRRAARRAINDEVEYCSGHDTGIYLSCLSLQHARF